MKPEWFIEKYRELVQVFPFYGKLKERVVQNNMTLLLVSHHAQNSSLISDHVYLLTREGIKDLNKPF